MLKKLLSFRSKYFLKLCLQRFKKGNDFGANLIDTTKKQVYFFLAADYGNLGDVAITYAQSEFIRRNTDFQVVEIPISKSLEGFWFVRKNIKKNDIIVLVGGGNMGDGYDQIEYIRQLVIRFFHSNKIISFPQTIDFSKSKNGDRALKHAQKIYNNHPNLYLSAREVTSYKMMETVFPNCKIMLSPDIVMSLNKTQEARTRSGAIICLRDDSEKHLSDDQNGFIIDIIRSHFSKVSFYDTHIQKSRLSCEERNEELNKIWSAFKGAELVVTDRLHGMIFCHITGTPALVFQNNNHKIRDTYEWINDNPNITLITEFSENEISVFLEKEKYRSANYEYNLSSFYNVLLNSLKA